MKYLSNYKDFNEGFLTNLFGKLFKNLLSGFDDKEFTNQANITIDSIEKSKNIKELPNIIIKVQKELIVDVENAEDLKGINEFIKKDITMINMILNAASKKFAMDILKPNKLYKESSNKLLQEVLWLKKHLIKTKNFKQHLNRI